MKQVKINDILYVMDTVAYQITEDTDVDIIYVPEDSYSDYVQLNPTLDLTKHNYHTIRCTYELEYFKPIKDRYLTIEAITDCTVNFTKESVNADRVIYYSEDCGNTWQPLESDVAVSAGKGIIFKSNLKSNVQGRKGLGNFVVSGSFNVSGNPLSLVKSDKFVGIDDISRYSYIFAYLFNGCSGLISAKNLSLNYVAVPYSGFLSMFVSCTNLIEVPELPATTLALFCYQYMFWGCSSLEKAQTILPAKTLVDSCYWEMFGSCSNLKETPKLPATTLAEYCYNYMFRNCTNLVTAPELPATTLASSCYNCMFDSCTSLTTVPVLPATTLADWCYAAMFWGCASLTTAPELPAETLTEGCYNDMFENCSSLNSITIKATDISASECLNTWLKGVSATGTFTKKAGVTYPTGNNGIPSGWTVVEI